MTANALDSRLDALFAEEITPALAEATANGVANQGMENDPFLVLRMARIYATRSRFHALPTDEARTLAAQAVHLFDIAWNRLGQPKRLHDHIAVEMVTTPALASEGLGLVFRHACTLPDSAWLIVAALKGAQARDQAVTLLDDMVRAGMRPADTYLRFSQTDAIYAAFQEAGLPVHEAVESVRAAAAADGVRPALFVTQPKSGTMFLTGNLTETCHLMRLALSIDSFPDDHIVPAFLGLFAKGGALASEHLDAKPATLDALAAAGVDRILVHVRDPRQAAVSWIHHICKHLVADRYYLRLTEIPPIPDGFDHWPQDRQHRFIVDGFFAAAVEWVEGWWRVARDDGRFTIGFSEFAAMRRDPMAALGEAVSFFGLDHRFDRSRVIEAEKGRRHYRKGATDEWRGVFDDALKARMWDRLSAEPGMAAHFGWTQ